MPDEMQQMHGEDRKMIRLQTMVLSLLLAGAMATQTPLLAAASTSYTDTVAGWEVYATSTTGYFTGQASGDLPGIFYTEIVHTPLSSGSAVMTGGSFYLYTTLNSHSALIEGTYQSGQVSLAAPSTGCSNQIYKVSGALTNVGPYGGAETGTGSFMGTLTHYRTLVFGRCITYAASVTGGVTLDF